ncbi:hypothetical protein [Streptomyces noursei]|uniref:hypothetical protein n=1 Tax=Streptomyces noursei TaxID=1971 RepID=UPI003802E457
MTSQPVNRGGRPPVGPTISSAYPQSLLDQIHAAAGGEGVARAVWLRRAAERAIPHVAYDRGDTIAPATAELGGWLDAAREWALDVDAPQEEREFRAAAYGECVTVVGDALRQALAALPLTETRDAYAQAEAADPTETPELGLLWGRASGTEMAAGILHGLVQALPVDALRVRERASLDDPQMDLEA